MCPSTKKSELNRIEHMWGNLPVYAKIPGGSLSSLQSNNDGGEGGWQWRGGAESALKFYTAQCILNYINKATIMKTWMWDNLGNASCVASVLKQLSLDTKHVWTNQLNVFDFPSHYCFKHMALVPGMHLSSTHMVLYWKASSSASRYKHDQQQQVNQRRVTANIIALGACIVLSLFRPNNIHWSLSSCLSCHLFSDRGVLPFTFSSPFWSIGVIVE